MSIRTEHDALFDRIAEIIADNHPALQGSVLGDLVATWIAGHRSTEGGAETDALREDLLGRHVAVVRTLIPVIAAQIDARRRAH